MEKRLKKQRNRLFARVGLILTAVWLMVSASFCVIRLYAENSDVQNRELANLAYAKQQMSAAIASVDAVGVVITNTNVLYSEDNNSDGQFIVTDQADNRVIINTNGKIGVEYGTKANKENSVPVYGFLDYNTVRDKLNDEDFKIISDYLNRVPGAGKRYDLICTKFHMKGFEIIPLELKIALVDINDAWFISDKLIKTFDLSGNKIKGQEVFPCNDMKRNIVPKGFLLDGEFSKDYIGQLSDAQKAMVSTTVSTGFLEYVFYATDYLNLYNNIIINQDYDVYDKRESNSLSYSIQYARKISLWENCKVSLIAGVSVIFLFFAVIAFVLCFMIWKMVKSQILQEQRRSDITNALAHDIKTPLFVISGYAYSLRENINSAERDSCLSKIIEQTDEINDLVHNMLSFSKLDSYMMTLNKTNFDLAELMSGLAGDFSAAAGGGRISFVRGGSNEVNADRELLKTAFKNLVDNALRYSLPDSGIMIEVKDRTVKIINESEPLTKSELKRIWQPYVRKDKSRHRKGNGLGLSIVKSILDLHSAKYDMTMRGSTLTFYAEFR